MENKQTHTQTNKQDEQLHLKKKLKTKAATEWNKQANNKQDLCLYSAISQLDNIHTTTLKNYDEWIIKVLNES